MPEARDRLTRGRGRESALVVGVHPVHDFFTAASSQRQSDHGTDPFQTPLADNKENIPPESSSRRRLRGRPKKSPLPAWYPRTPLREITAVVSALQRRRRRIRAASAPRRGNQQHANSSPFTSPSSAHELDDSQQAHPLQGQESRLKASDLPPDSSTSKKNSPEAVDYCQLESSHSAGKFSSKDDSTSISIANYDSLDEIDRIVKENFQRIAKMHAKKPKTSTLMSMR